MTRGDRRTREHAYTQARPASLACRTDRPDQENVMARKKDKQAQKDKKAEKDKKAQSA